MTTSHIPPITEDDIAQFLTQTPGFFERHAEVLASVQITSPHGARAVSLQERQAEMLREKIKVLENRLVDMIRHGSENSVTTNRLLQWAAGLHLVHDPAVLPQKICDDIRDQFMVPQAALRVWGVAPHHADAPFVRGVSNDTKSFASSLATLYCGMHVNVEALRWLDEPLLAASLALIPLRDPGKPGAAAFGLLVLASPDASRYQDDMATDYLEHIGRLASAALTRLLAPAADRQSDAGQPA